MSVNTLAQALEALLVELKAEEGQALFLQYQALPVVSALLRGGNAGLLAPAVDVLMLMCAESCKCLQMHKHKTIVHISTLSRTV